jgi:hypothetical protein
MKNLLIFNLGRRSRTLVAPALAMAALAILLLGIGSELSTAAASALPPVRPEFTTAATTYTLYLPLIVYSPVAFYDDFSSSSSGWFHKVTIGNCYYKYTSDGSDHFYRMTVTGKNTCIGPNIFYMPYVHDGTFIVKVRRHDTNTNPVHYGFYFSAAPDAANHHWLVEVRPDKISDCEGSEKPYFWLSYKDGSSSDLVNDDDTCTSSINTGDSWNVIKAIRKGNRVQIYINNNLKFDVTKDVLNSSDEGYFDLIVKGLSDGKTVDVDFDYVQILNSTSPL